MPVRATLYSKPGCHLCQRVEMEIRDVRRRVEFEFDVVNIMGDPALAVKYGFDIPVVAIDGEIYCEHVLDAEAFEKHVFGLCAAVVAPNRVNSATKS